MFSKEFSQEINRKYKSAGSAIVQLAKQPLVFGEVDAKAFMGGLSLIRDMKDSDLSKLKSMSIKDVAEMKDKAKSDKDKQIGFAIHILHKAMSVMADAKYGTDLRNTYAIAEKKRQKEYFADNSTMFSNQVQVIQSVVNLLGEQVDLGYMTAFNSVDARSARTLRVSDLLWQVRFTELGKGESPELSGGADEQNQDLTGKFYGAGVLLDDRDSRFSPVSVNMMLSAFRIKGEQILSHVAYKEIFMYDSAQISKALISQYAATGNDDAMTARWRDTANARYTLNEATADMIDAANHISAGNKKTQNRSEAPLSVPSDTPIIVFYNHRNNELMNDVQNLQSPMNLPQTGLNYNYVFQPTTKAPISGAWQTDDATVRDDYGTFGTVKEKSTKNHQGVKIVIPGYRNVNATFEGLTIAQDRRNVNFSTIVVARQMALQKMDNRQSAWVKLK